MSSVYRFPGGIHPQEGVGGKGGDGWSSYC